MARSQSPGLMIGKWLVVPILLALLGYYVIGPYFGKHKAGPKQETLESAATAPDSTDAAPPKHTSRSKQGAATVSTIAPPDVDITVHKVSRQVTDIADSAPESKPRRHKKAHVDPDELPKTHDATDDQPDEGGSAGSTTAG